MPFPYLAFGKAFFTVFFGKENNMAKINVYSSPRLSGFSPDVSSVLLSDGAEYTVLPGFCDVHVHFREPGFSYKETTGSRAAKAGGYSAVCTMPNLNPVPDCVQSLKIQTDIAKRDSEVSIYPYAAITKGEQGRQLSDLEALAPLCVAFSDDGRGVQDGGLMYEAMQCAAALDKIIAAHCEVNGLLRGGYIHDGVYARARDHRGICSRSEWEQVERDIALADRAGCAYHVCHISCRESVQLIRDAKKSGINVTCETAPHYLVLDENDLREDGRFKMNPPLRSRDDRLALLEGVLDGTVDIIATDHAPHSAEEKTRGLEKSAFGIVGLETAFPVLYTFLVKKGIIDMDRLMELLVINPRERFKIPYSGFSVWNLDMSYTLDPESFESLGRATPFAGMTLFAKHIQTNV